jgi:hypothetical protein
MENITLYDKKISDSLDWQVLVYFTSVYRNECFEKAIRSIVKKESYILDYAACVFPNWDSVDPDDHFEGVTFEAGSLTNDSEVIISEEKCLELLKEAVNKYLEKHPERKSALDDIWKESVW